MYSIVPLIGRLTDEPMSFDGIIVPADSIIELNIHAMNHRQDVWPDHEVSSSNAMFNERITMQTSPVLSFYSNYFYDNNQISLMSLDGLKCIFQ